MKTATTLDELRRMAALNAVSLPSVRADGDVLVDEAPAVRPLVDGAQAVRISELIRTSRELARRRTPEETAELERRLEERED